MLKPTLAISALLLITSVIAQNTVRLEIKSLPSYHPSGADIYVAGSFNGWNPQDEKYKLQHDDKGIYSISLKLENGVYEYKITRGGWDKVECKSGGAGIENRIIKVETDGEVDIAVEEWADRFPAKPRANTAGKNVHIIDTAFLIPQLKKVRRVWIYLPQDYASSKKHYPVLYMHDGQNVFDDATSFSGEWGVDEFLDSNKTKQCIVVAVDHGGNKRLNEYNPYDNDRFGKGEGDEYLDFLVKTLKPFIDKRYRTLKDRKNTFIAGSSMGGLISLYAVLKYPDTFGGAGVFSPAFWISGNSKIYFYAGKQESETMVTDILKAFEDMNKVSKSKMQTVIRDDGKHNEATWRREFPGFYKWIVR
jgi:predicted alpha/beta superfamily hydrolase